MRPVSLLVALLRRLPQGVGGGLGPTPRTVRGRLLRRRGFVRVHICACVDILSSLSLFSPLHTPLRRRERAGEEKMPQLRSYDFRNSPPLPQLRALCNGVPLQNQQTQKVIDATITTRIAIPIPIAPGGGPRRGDGDDAAAGGGGGDDIQRPPTSFFGGRGKCVVRLGVGVAPGTGTTI